MDKLKDKAQLMLLQEEACQRVSELNPLASSKTINVNGVEIEISPAMLSLVRSGQVTLYAVDNNVPIVKLTDKTKSTARSQSGAPAVWANDGQRFNSEKEFAVILSYSWFGGMQRAARFIQFRDSESTLKEAKFPAFPAEATNLGNKIVGFLQDADLQRGVLHEPQIVGQFRLNTDPWAFVQPMSWEKARVIGVFARWNAPFDALEAVTRKVEV